MSLAEPKTIARAALASQTRVLRQNLQTPIPAPRIALERKISLRFPHFQGFLTECSSNISITGMFICSRFPQQPGTILDFEFNLSDGLKLIRGTGEVVWVRRKKDGDLPAGMGLRFLRLDAESRRLIRWAVEKEINDGGQPFDLDAGLATSNASLETTQESRSEASRPSQPGRAPSTDAEVSRTYPYAGYAAAKRSRLRWVPAAGSAALLVAVLFLSFLRQSGAESAASAAAAPSPRALGAVASALLQPPPGAEADEPVPEVGAEGLVDTAEAWALAWAEQRAEDYLGFYSRRFSPPDSLSRVAWEAQRRDRISRPDFIQVGISGLETELLGGGQARVTFDQVYRSDSYRDATRKTLELVLEDGRWKILAETSEA